MGIYTRGRGEMLYSLGEQLYERMQSESGRTNSANGKKNELLFEKIQPRAKAETNGVEGLHVLLFPDVYQAAVIKSSIKNGLTKAVFLEERIIIITAVIKMSAYLVPTVQTEGAAPEQMVSGLEDIAGTEDAVQIVVT